MAKRPIRMASDPAEENIVEAHYEAPAQVGARFLRLFGETRTEKLSGIPVAPPVGYEKQPSMVDHIRGLVRSEHLRYAAQNSGAETFEEADDFDVGDDIDPHSPYEDTFEPAAAEAAAPPPPPAPAPQAAAESPSVGAGGGSGTPNPSAGASPPPPGPKTP